MQAAIEQYFEQNKDVLLDSLRELIAINSVKGESSEKFPFGEGPAAALDYTLQLAQRLGLSTVNHEHYVGTINLEPSLEARLGILTHVDIVDVGANWTKEPFGGQIEDGKMYGRGATDDKGPTIAALFALAAVKALGVELTSSARLIVGTDEESGCGDTKYYFKKESPPPLVFSPDGEFPVINTEKGGLRTSFEADCSTDVSNADSARLVSFEGGYRVNVVPPEATCVVAGISLEVVEGVAQQTSLLTGAAFKITQQAEHQWHIHAEGKGAHASTPDGGINAITALLTLLTKLPLAPSALTTALHGVAKVFPHEDFYAHAAGIAMEDEMSGKLTMNLAILKVEAGVLYGFIDSRLPICATMENTMDKLAAALDQYGITLARKGYSEAHHTPADTPFVKTLLQAYERYSGNEGYCQFVGGGTYVHGIPGGVAFGCTMPGVDANVHGADEYIIIEDLLTSAKIFTQVIIELCGEQGA